MIGYGKMGKTIERIALERGHQIVARLDNSPEQSSDLGGADVAIEFTVPAAAVQNIERCFQFNVPIVVGTTGWYQHYATLAEKALISQKGLFTASNFSVGVNLFFRINEILAEMMNSAPEYDVSMEEIHHVHKLDAPSGTAITLAEKIISALERKKQWALTEGDVQEKPKSDILSIHSKRIDEVPGSHSVLWESEVDRLYLEHVAISRDGFALGAVLAAEFMSGKTGVYGMNDLLGF